MQFAHLVLTIRAFCEVVIVGEQDRNPVNVRAIAAGRDVTYGVLSVIFVYLVVFAIARDPETNPLLSQERRAVEMVKYAVLSKMSELTADHRTTAPTLASLLKAAEPAAR